MKIFFFIFVAPLKTHIIELALPLGLFPHFFCISIFFNFQFSFDSHFFNFTFLISVFQFQCPHSFFMFSCSAAVPKILCVDLHGVFYEVLSPPRFARGQHIHVVLVIGIKHLPPQTSSVAASPSFIGPHHRQAEQPIWRGSPHGLLPGQHFPYTLPPRGPRTPQGAPPRRGQAWVTPAGV